MVFPKIIVKKISRIVFFFYIFLTPIFFPHKKFCFSKNKKFFQKYFFMKNNKQDSLCVPKCVSPIQILPGDLVLKKKNNEIFKNIFQEILFHV